MTSRDMRLDGVHDDDIPAPTNKHMYLYVSIRYKFKISQVFARKIQYMTSRDVHFDRVHDRDVPAGRYKYTLKSNDINYFSI